ncbi:hypothetical protein V8G54_014999 [Vigna mungo]|uniref:Uncharacterized protein n=1 Tax=Vigna mungo TaxID=3915 RepID=A0AAQ3NHQ1_VIGMU
MSPFSLSSSLAKSLFISDTSLHLDLLPKASALGFELGFEENSIGTTSFLSQALDEPSPAAFSRNVELLAALTGTRSFRSLTLRPLLHAKPCADNTIAMSTSYLTARLISQWLLSSTEVFSFIFTKAGTKWFK